MAGKARVHELAKELGISSKDVVAKLAEIGEYVKGPSSTVEAPVVRKLHEAFPASAAPPAKKAPAKKAAAKATAAPAPVVEAAPRSGRARPRRRPGRGPGRPAPVAAVVRPGTARAISGSWATHTGGARR